MLKKLWSHFTKHRQKQFGLLLILMLLASFAEIISIGAVIPFLGVLTAPEHVYQYEMIEPLIEFFQLTKPDQLILPLTVIFIIAAFVAGTIRLVLLYAMTRLSFAAGADLSIDIYRRTLYQEYSVHLARNSSEIINGVINKTGSVIGGVISPVLTLISSTIVLIGVMGVLFAINIKIASISLIGLGLIYWVVIGFTHRQLKENSQTIADQSTYMIKYLQEGLGGIRDVIIDGSQEFYCDLYRNADLSLRRAAGNNVFISGSPRYVLEAVGMALIAGLAFIMSQQQGGITTVVPILGAFALGAQRLLPTLQQLYGAYSSIRGAKASLKDVLKLLDQPLPSIDLRSPTEDIKLSFNSEIKLNDLSFRYTKNTSHILKNINFKITKGARIGFIGVTGSGKSTLLDIIMGLLLPTDGSLIVDGQTISEKNRKAWHANIAHVPQNIYLSDASIEENIAFGIPKDKIDYRRVECAAKQAQIEELIIGWSEGYKTLVGERGVKLSGGQRQRIGIARAFYKQATLLVFDEATSALDGETEQAVMEAIDKLGRELTILVIAHRLTTLEGCDQIFKLKNNILISI